MPNNPRIRFPADGEAIAVSSTARVFVAQGRVVVDPGAHPAGLNGHLVLPGTNTVKAVGDLIAWHRAGRRDNVYHWAVLFDLGDTGAVPDGNYDLIASTYLGSMAVKTATENNSSAKSEGVAVTTVAGLGITVSFPANNAAINGNQFTPYGTFTNGDRPTRAVMTETTTAVAHNPSTLFASTGGASGYWYAQFPPIPSGTYTLDVMAGTVLKSVSGLTVT